jgi:hypothetical protein
MQDVDQIESGKDYELMLAFVNVVLTGIRTTLWRNLCVIFGLEELVFEQEVIIRGHNGEIGIHLILINFGHNKHNYKQIMT